MTTRGCRWRARLPSLEGSGFTGAPLGSFFRGEECPHRCNGRLLAAAALVSAIVGSGGAAYADEVANDLDNIVDVDGSRRMPLTVGANGSTVLRIVPANGDGKNGCNLTGSTAATFSVGSSAGSVATVSPATVDEFGIGAEDRGTSRSRHSRRRHGHGLGSPDEQHHRRQLRLAPASFMVTVTAPANTAPRVRVAGAEDGGVYQLGGYSPEPGVHRHRCRGQPRLTDQRRPCGRRPTGTSSASGQVSASCSYTDAGGLTGHDEVTFTVVDTVAPTMQRLSLLPRPTPRDGTTPPSPRPGAASTRGPTSWPWRSPDHRRRGHQPRR